MERIYQTRIYRVQVNRSRKSESLNLPVASSTELNLGARILPINGKREREREREIEREEEEEGVLCGNKSNLKERKKYLSRN